LLGLLGMAAWIAGQGALANLVLDRAATTDGYSEYTLFEVVRGVLSVGISPREWDTICEKHAATSGCSCWLSMLTPSRRPLA
jgi:hypothetical protein